MKPVSEHFFWEIGVCRQTWASLGVEDGRGLWENWRTGEIIQYPENDERRIERRPVPLLLYDLWNDSYCLKSLHEERPDLVKKYTEFLEAQFEAHQSLAEHFTRSEDSPLTPEQLRTLRSLGYIQ